ncbi:E3 ubiquitin-protein ligase ATL6-like [Vigna umbellata]|uniref:E3 ubiquitin-protein ligase ATL6-like n=1 Tax=Vigna umbellata TaxID=87088 RepID=UPI001F5F1AA2|nr:E3 ubiquitin-protein ligase ATL6-like [Vigna umbellata]
MAKKTRICGYSTDKICYVYLVPTNKRYLRITGSKYFNIRLLTGQVRVSYYPYPQVFFSVQFAKIGPNPKSLSRVSSSNGGIYVFLLLIFIVPLAAAQSTNNNQNESYYNRFSPSMVIIIVILIVVVFLMGFFSIYIRHCTHFPFASIRNLTKSTSRPRRGLDQAVMDTFPMLEYSVVNIHKLGKGTLECTICLNKFEDTETMHLIHKCDHVFHTECIDEACTTVTTESTMRRQRW